MNQSGPAPIPDLNNQYGTETAGGNSGGLPNRWWVSQRVGHD
jgi:hypothetical protein